MRTRRSNYGLMLIVGLVLTSASVAQAARNGPASPKQNPLTTPLGRGAAAAAVGVVGMAVKAFRSRQSEVRARATEARADADAHAEAVMREKLKALMAAQEALPPATAPAEDSHH